MKFTSKYVRQSIAVMLCGSILFAGCGKTVSLDNQFQVYQEKSASGNASVVVENPLFADELCVTDQSNENLEQVSSSMVKAAGIFNTVTHEVPYCKNLYQKIYPASTTKILTAYLAIKNGHLKNKVTISKNAVALPAGASNCGLREGDVLTMEQLLYGLMMESGNDAAIAIAEEVSGSVENFATLMNQTAKELGATHSHFVNPNGLHDDDHYTTVYDLYLIFNQAIQSDTFYKLIHTKSYDASYSHENGEKVAVTFESTNHYLIGDFSCPSGISVIGGKTGTTNDAGHCLVLLSENKKKQPIISIAMKAQSTGELYHFMNQILKKFSNL